MQDRYTEEVRRWFYNSFKDVVKINSLNDLQVINRVSMESNHAMIFLAVLIGDARRDVGTVIYEITSNAAVVKEVTLVFEYIFDLMSDPAPFLAGNDKSSELMDRIADTHQNIVRWESGLTAFINSRLLDSQSQPAQNELDSVLDLLGYLGYLKHYYEDLYHEVKTNPGEM